MFDAEVIAREQLKNKSLQEAVKENPGRFETTILESGEKLILHMTKENKAVIYVPNSLATVLVTWYHDALLHPGDSRLVKTV